ncbi:signal peptide peptidase SppA [Candidatus Sumerlaeota bacterium]|nr:signal peptide peptidase SppA [Candidatus Sumerlaeota bacterium]
MNQTTRLRWGLFSGCINLPPGLFGGGRGPVELQRIIPADHFYTIDQILVLDLHGVISMQDSRGFFGETPGMVVQLKDRLKEAVKNKYVKAVILKVDSPGGGVTASDVIYHELLEFKKEAKIPVIAIMEDVAASGGLYVSMAADEIYAYPTAITGSIGVITILPSLEGLSEKIGLEMRVIKSGKNKDLGSPWRSLSDEEKKIFQSMIDSMYARFTGVILEGRGKKGLTREKLMEFADGRVLQADEAAKLGLIDGVCYMDDVIKRAKTLAKVRDAEIVSYEYPGTYRGNIYASAPAPGNGKMKLGGDINLLKIDTGLESALPRDARFLYMWLP